jgi:hypothetical protein
MLQRLRPEPMSRVQLGSAALQGLQALPTSASQQSLSAGSESGASEGGAADSSQTSAAGSAQGSAWSPKSSVKSSVSFAEQLVTSRDDVFELFDKDGPGSALYVYSSKRLASS